MKRTWAKKGKWGEQGGAHTVETVLLVPSFFLLIFLAIQIGLFWNANNVAHSAASAAYNEARLEGASAGAGDAAARSLLAKHNSPVEGLQVKINRAGESVTATVTGRGPSIVPFWEGPKIQQQVSGPTERWIQR